MQVDEFDFELPEDRIALRPVSPRHTARQLVVGAGGLSHHNLQDSTVWNFPDYLTPQDLVIVNNTKVIPSYLFAKRSGTRGDLHTEVNLHKQVNGTTWLAFAKKTKRLRIGDRLEFVKKFEDNLGNNLAQTNDLGLNHTPSPFPNASLSAIILEKHEGGEILLRFEANESEITEKLLRIGHMPIPPYIASKRAVDESDAADYQTMFAAHSGAVAAPTASLHFTPELLHKMAQQNIRMAEVTLHVGAGTFLPVKVTDTKDHKMHAEWGEVSADIVAKILETKANGGRIIAVGTTVLRILESAAQSGTLKQFCGDTSIFITPGYDFKVVDILMTNFHLPRSTLFMLVSAFAGLPQMRAAYDYAMRGGYRFYSYGDSCLLFRQ
ncbi:MAG: tRNA preQ1(34) S-adenosylmethionine ribosyltransferase-isomerase QueA [Alphaproteobacteria bacterium]|nr:tRNA preQ1(34) S-adenosylmethionine ribosyltransferase-isomerase QueA [Alphaproteobacteria bacterium]